MNPLFTINNLKVTASDKNILKIDNLKIPENKITAIIGPNGAGKTTLLNSLLNIYPATDIKFQNECIKSAIKKRKIAWVDQHNNFNMPLTLLEFVQLGYYKFDKWFGKNSQNNDEKHLFKILNEFNLLHLKDNYIQQLSGGEKQRINIVRAVLQNAPVLLLDEPCNHLDIRHQYHLMHFLNINLKDFSTVTVLHDLNLAANYTQNIILLNHGEIIDHGSVLDVMTDKQLSEIYGCKVSRKIDKDGIYFVINI